MNTDIDFTDRERLILSYYRDKHLSDWKRYAISHGSWLVASAVFILLALLKNDLTWAVIAFALVFWLPCVSIYRQSLYTDSFRSIIKKYESKIQDLTKSQP